MCHSIYMSTTSDLNLVYKNHAGFLDFEKYDLPEEDRLRKILNHKNIWYISNIKGNCSCGFRHSHNNIDDFGFHAPMDWCMEEEHDILATKLLYRVLSELLESGNEVDILDEWDELDPELIPKLEVNLKEVGEEQFLFYADMYYTLSM